MRDAPLRALLAHCFECPDSPFISRASGFYALADPRFLLCELFIKQRFGARCCLGLLFAKHQKFGVIRLPQCQMASIQFPDTIADALQKPSVMGDEHDGALKHSDLLFKPVDGGDV